MNDAEGYDVLRLIEHSRSCYVSSEYVEGTPFIRWLKYHPNLSKEQLFLWIHELARQLECIHKCRGRPCYKYVNPYSIIITEKKELYFLDMNAKSNERTIAVMQRRSIREHFLPPEESYYQTESVFLDIYGMGKTIQYLLSVSDPEPALTRREEARFHKIISRSLDRHSKRAYTQVSELRKYIPVFHEKEAEKGIGKNRIFIITAAAFVLVSGIAVYLRFIKTAEYQEETDSLGQEEIQTEQAVTENIRTEDKEDASALKKELGFLYFLDKKDYGKSREYFSGDEGDGLSDRLKELSEYMLQKNVAGRAADLRELLGEIEEMMPEDENEEYLRCLIEGYRLLGDEAAAREIIRLGGKCRTNASEDVKRELAGYMAYACERAGELDDAVKEYQDMLGWEREDAFKEEVYKKLVFLYQEKEEPDQAGRICRQGIEELEDSEELRLIHIGMLCADPGVAREICAQTMKEYIEEIPEIAEKEEFQKLKQEYGIIMEGEEIWVGR